MVPTPAVIQAILVAVVEALLETGINLIMKHNYYLAHSEEGFHKIAYTESGVWAPSSPSVICVHGLTRNSRDFDDLANFLAIRGRYVLCPDVAGRGDSDWFKAPCHYNFKQYVADMVSLIARTNSNQIDWIGTSMGGIIGMMIAAQANNPIRKLVINDIGPQIPITGLRRLGQYAGKDPVFHNLEEAKLYMKKNYSDFGDLSEEQWDHFTQHSVYLTATETYHLKVDPGIKHAKSTTQWLNEFIRHPIKALEGVLYDIDLWELWNKINCPVLVIHGKRSDLLTNEIIKKMRESGPNIELIEIDNAGHAPALLEPKNHELITNWLSK